MAGQEHQNFGRGMLGILVAAFRDEAILTKQQDSVDHHAIKMPVFLDGIEVQLSENNV